LSEHGDLLREARLEKKLTLRELAFRVGFDAAYIGNIEHGKQRGSVAILVKLANALDLVPEAVLQKAGIIDRDWKSVSDVETDLDTREFHRLKPWVKKALLKLAPFIEEQGKPGPGG